MGERDSSVFSTDRRIKALVLLKWAKEAAGV
jgi:hypothetical protein